MSENQTTPPTAKAVPALLAFFVVFFALKWLFSGKDKEEKPETAPADISIKPITIPVSSAPRVVVLPPTVPSVPKTLPPAPVSAIAPHPKSIMQASPPPIKKRVITPENVATVFRRSTRPLTRPAAVAALRSLGFGRTAAYEALSPNGRYASRLHVAPDGTITWAD